MMPSSILNSDDGVISGTAGLKNSGGDDAVLLIQTKGVTAATVSASQVFDFVNPPTGIPTATIATTAEAQAGTDNTNFLTPLRLREGFNASGTAPVFACRSFVNFNGNAGASVRASGNVSSVVRTGTGQYTINFATAMPDANYSIAGQYRALNGGDPGIISQFGALSVGSFPILAGLRTTSPFESATTDTITLAVFR